jgi:predicted dehydrogenase
MAEQSRREFIEGTAKVGAGVVAAAGVLGTSKTAWAGANDKVRVAVIGIHGRGKDHIGGWNGLKNVEIATLCDVDENLFEPTVKSFFAERTDPKDASKKIAARKKPKFETDLRRVMEDKDIDAVSIATPNHWHSLAAIWAIEAGKDVYVEKPCSHNVFEGRQLVNAARKHNRIVQHGTQCRSNPGMKEAMKHLHDGTIGEVYMARGLCYKNRASIGKKAEEPAPAGVNYDTWLGPAPQRAFSPNRFHYNWHWHWDYGNSDIGNQGVHQMDIARWGLGVKHPSRVSAASGKFLFDDDKETPNVITTSFDYPGDGPLGKMLVFEVRPWHTNDEKNAKIGVLFYGSEGYMVIDSYDHYQIYLGPKEEQGPGGGGGANHYENFIDAVRKRDRSILNAEIEEGHYSSALCHLGLISARLGRSFRFDPEKEQVLGDEEANKMLTRQYREPFVVKPISA